MSVTSAAPNSEKGIRYFNQLDQALCNGNWAEVPELARKTEKHAPQRKCFTLTARSEAQIASRSQFPTTSTSAASLDELVSGLTEAISTEEKYPEDVYTAKVCLGELHWLRQEYQAVLQALPHDGTPSSSASSRATALGWLEVCAVKADYLEIAAREALGQESEVRNAFLAAVTRTPGSRTAELRRWTERRLAKACMFMRATNEQPTLEGLSQSLRCFQSWSDFWQRSPPPLSASSAGVSGTDIPRQRIWRAYYDLLSTILQSGLLYNPSPSSASDLLLVSSDGISDDDYTTAKTKQRTGMKTVERMYESFLLDETQFPKASQTNTEVEEWVHQTISNWTVFTGPRWTDVELGDGGKASLGRVVLDILYRAATKTFHSTPIVRHLFTVHASLGEFELAMHAFNSYAEIISKGKARAEKTGKHETGVDTDDTAIRTAAEAVRLLCGYGDRDQGEKAMEVNGTIEKWMARSSPLSIEDAKTSADDNRANDTEAPSQSTEDALQPITLAAAYQAIGICQGHWARLTYDSDARSGLQSEAIQNLLQAQTYEQDSVETAYTLALLLAETRDVTQAIQVLKRALISGEYSNDDPNESNDIEEIGRKRMLVPVWHLLALCLTAKEEYEQGAQMCEAAFEQFGDADVLLGENGRGGDSWESEKTTGTRTKGGIVDQMQGFEKESLLQIKISQLTLVELMEGAEAAVDASHELLALYARLFGNLDTSKAVAQKPPPTATSAAPSKLGGTLRSIAGSIRPKSMRSMAERDPRMASTVSVAKLFKPRAYRGPSNISAEQSADVPIAITVTNEDGVHTEKQHHHKHLPFMHRGVHQAQNSSVREKPSFSKEARPSTPNNTIPATQPETEKSETPAILPAVQQNHSAETPASPEQPLNAISRDAEHDTWSPPTGHQDQAPRQDVRLPAPYPTSNLVPNARLPTAQDRQHKISLLIKIWLFIAGLYLRADLLDDAVAAAEEASRLVESFEVEVGTEHSSARRFFEKGWGGGKSVDDLWADVLSAKGTLAVARELPFQAISHYEQALAYSPDHPGTIVGLSNLLLDIYEEKMPAEEPEPPLSSRPSASNSTLSTPIPPAPRPPLPTKKTSSIKEMPRSKPASKKLPHRDLTPAELNRLAARDRAYMLLSTLTRLGSGWDNSEAWFTLARAHELSKQINKAKQALWWVVELEQNEPMRPWREVAAGGLTL